MKEIERFVSEILRFRGSRSKANKCFLPLRTFVNSPRTVSQSKWISMIHVAGPCPMWNILQDPTCDLDGEIAWEGERRTKRRQLFTRVLYACITKNPPRFKRLFLPSFPSFQRSHDSLISCTCFGGKGNRVYLRFFSFFRLFYLIPFPPSSFFFLDKKTRNCFRSTRRSRTKRTWRRMRTTPSPASRKRVSRVSERKSRRVENYTVKLISPIDLTFILPDALKPA